MKKKHLKILALVVAFASIIGLGLFANALAVIATILQTDGK